MNETRLTELINLSRAADFSLACQSLAGVSWETILSILPLLGVRDGEIRDKLAWSTLSKVLRHESASTAVRLQALEVLLSNEYLFCLPFTQGADEAVRRSFSILTVADIVYGDRVNRLEFDQRLLSITAHRIREYLLLEEDERGFDVHLGWVHCLAHAADCLSELNAHPNTPENELAANTKAILDLIERRGGRVFAWHEEYRLALPIAKALLLAKLEPLFGKFSREFLLKTTARQNFMNTFRAVYLELIWSDAKPRGPIKMMESIIREVY